MIGRTHKQRVHGQTKRIRSRPVRPGTQRISIPIRRRNYRNHRAVCGEIIVIISNHIGRILHCKTCRKRRFRRNDAVGQQKPPRDDINAGIGVPLKNRILTRYLRVYNLQPVDTVSRAYDSVQRNLAASTESKSRSGIFKLNILNGHITDITHRQHISRRGVGLTQPYSTAIQRIRASNQ